MIGRLHRTTKNICYNILTPAVIIQICLVAPNVTLTRRYVHTGLYIYLTLQLQRICTFLMDIFIKHLRTGHKGNSEFCFPEKLNVPRGGAEGNIEVKGKQNSLFPEGSVIKCFAIPPDSKIEKAPKKIILLRPLHTLAALAKLSVTITVFFFAANKNYRQY